MRKKLTCIDISKLLELKKILLEEKFLKMEDTMDKKVHEIYCNSCGKKIETTDNIKREDYLSIKKEWGYFSKKDGEIHSIFLCESCYDIWTKQFKLPVKVEKQTELL